MEINWSNLIIGIAGMMFFIVISVYYFQPLITLIECRRKHFIKLKLRFNQPVLHHYQNQCQIDELLDDSIAELNKLMNSESHLTSYANLSLLYSLINEIFGNATKCITVYYQTRLCAKQTCLLRHEYGFYDIPIGPAAFYIHAYQAIFFTYRAARSLETKIHELAHAAHYARRTLIRRLWFKYEYTDEFVVEGSIYYLMHQLQKRNLALLIGEHTNALLQIGYDRFFCHSEFEQFRKLESFSAIKVASADKYIAARLILIIVMPEFKTSTAFWEFLGTCHDDILEKMINPILKTESFVERCKKYYEMGWED